MTHRAVSAKRVLLETALVLAAALLLGTAPDARRLGTISGRVTSSTTSLGLPNTVIQFYDFNSEGGSYAATTTTDALGNYSISLPASTYGILTQNTLGYINEIFDNISCSAVCDVDSLTGVALPDGGSVTADFVLVPGGRIEGRVTDAATGLGIADVFIYFIDGASEVGFTSAITDANGDYLSDGGTVTGTVFAVTYNRLGYQNEAWDDKKCPECDGVVPTPMPVTNGVINGPFNFALDMGGKITGTVRDGNLVPLANLEMHFYDSTGHSVDVVDTDAAGNFVSGGLPAGSYYVKTDNDRGLVDKLWPGVVCINTQCDPAATGGTLVPVTIGGTAANINFILEAGGRLTGTLTNAVGGAPVTTSVFVALFDATGTFIGGSNSDDVTGAYSINGVPAGTTYAVVQGVSGFFNQMYNNLTCSTNCNSLQSTPIHVTAGATTGSINFALVPTTSVGTISGTVRDITAGLPGTVVNTLQVQLLSATGATLTTVNTNASGVYTFSNLPVASYYLRTVPANQLIGMVHALPNDVVCLNCTVTTTGTPVPVTAGATTTVDFNLTAGVRISGTVTNAAPPGAGIQGVAVQVFSASGVNLGQATTSASGQFTSRGLPDGTYFLRTANALGFVDKLYDNLFCSGPSCSVFNGTPIVAAGAGTIVGGRNFVLAQGGRISGNVVGPNPAQILQFQMSVQVYTETGLFLGNQGVDGSNNYLTFAVPAGRYYLRTANAIGLLDELYDNLPCVALAVCSITAGTPVDVVAGATTSGKNFALIAGGNIAGTVRDANTSALLNGVRVVAYLADGTAVKAASTNANGEYSIIGVPSGTYYVRTSVVGTSLFYLDELYNELPCPVTCTLTAGTPVVVTPGVTQGGKNFTLTPGGGGVTGTVRDRLGNLLGGITVQILLADGTLVKQIGSGGNGAFTVTLAAGTYYARTMVSSAGTYLDELYNELPCGPDCNVAAGAQIIVVNGATQGNIDFTLAPNLVKNGRFESGMTDWTPFDSPGGVGTFSVVGGVMQFSRSVPPAGTINQATIFQATGQAVPANTPLTATFQIGNTGPNRRYMKVLMVGDPGFGDLAACTFWLEAGQPLTTYSMKGHTTQAAPNVALYFYASSHSGSGGSYLLDNVALQVSAGDTIERIACIDPNAPAPPGGAVGPNLVTNGNFGTGTLANWSVQGPVTSQINPTGNVLEFIRTASPNPPAVPPAVILQATGQAMTENQIMTATFMIGNSSPVRKRVLILVHDFSFGDLVACTWWLSPNQPLSRYVMRLYASMAWTNATMAIYPATTGPDQWIRIDDITLQRTAGLATVGSECLEGSLAVGPGPNIPSGSGAGVAQGASMTGTGAAQDASHSGPQIVQSPMALDLRAATSATLAFESWLTTAGAWGEVQVRGEDGEWRTVQVVGPSDVWSPVSIDLTEYAGQVVDVRFVLYGAAGGAPEIWRIRRPGS